MLLLTARRWLPLPHKCISRRTVFCLSENLHFRSPGGRFGWNPDCSVAVNGSGYGRRRLSFQHSVTAQHGIRSSISSSAGGSSSSERNGLFAGLKSCVTSHRNHGTAAFGSQDSPFGFLFDIDGVFLRGQTALPAGEEALKRLVDHRGRFRVPTVFVTNAGNSRRDVKAEHLSQLFGVRVAPEQVIMAHSPLRMFHHYHDKHFLVSGQGAAASIAESVGFNNFITVEQLRDRFPLLDVVDMRRRIPKHTYEHDFTKIEGILLLGEPVNWETSLQLIIDVLLTDGQPTYRPVEVPRPHLPLLACNMDLLWMAEAPIPRFGHGSFLLCLEALWKKLTGDDLQYSALVGKPSEATYHYAESCLTKEASVLYGRRDGRDPRVARIYAVGDNPDTDIFGGNLYDMYLQKKHSPQTPSKVILPEVNAVLDIHAARQVGATSEIAKVVHHKPVTKDVQRQVEEVELSPAGRDEVFAESCRTILVESGVYSAAHQETQSKMGEVSYQHRDFYQHILTYKTEGSDLYKPHYVCKNVLEAVELVFDLERFPGSLDAGSRSRST